ncbi:related to metalloprotease [Ustilago trichophora]|uniref:Related to metalloprotease n=1 Tax=Ustilago trichophora TaxID=86804 RepID=A0A5C3DR79_9BASI|nr:related to metalloprotease [Ustilago trichophora]
MLTLRQLFFTLSVAFLVLQMHQQLQGTCQIEARPMQDDKSGIDAPTKPIIRCSSNFHTDPKIDEYTETLVKAERKRLADLRQSLSTSSAAARTLTDAQLLAQQPTTFQVVWHAIHDGAEGNLSPDAIKAQIDVLNKDYKKAGIAFNLQDINRVENAEWFRKVTPDSYLQYEMKTALHKGDVKTFNVYSLDMPDGVIGNCHPPWEAKTNLTNDGALIHYATLPGGSMKNFNQGRTLTHETGHFHGLYHVFENGCNPPGDLVDDTPPQKTITSGCPTKVQDSCPGGGVDSIHNFMDYSWDVCTTEFTEGQIVRMAAMIKEYRSL